MKHEETHAICFTHLFILERFQRITACDYRYLAERAQRWFPDLRCWDLSDLESALGNWCRMRADLS